MKKLIKSFLHILRNFVQNAIVNIRWYLNQPELPKSDKMMLHLGCGEINMPGFINIDKRPFPHIHYLSGVEKLPYIQDNQVDLIYISHCLEHIPKNKIEPVLNEYYRVLKKGGILRISVPDFKKIVNIYQSTGSINNILDPLFGSQEYIYNFHYISFDNKFLESLLRICNFKYIRKWEYGDGELKSFPDWSGKKICIDGNEFEISLNLEAIK